MSAARLFGGEPERVSAEAVMTEGGVDTRFAATMRMPGDVIGGVQLRLRHAAARRARDRGLGGSLFTDDPWHCVKPVIELRNADGDVEVIEAEQANAYRLEFEDVSAAIRGEHEPRLGRADAVGQARALEMLLESARS